MSADSFHHQVELSLNRRVNVYDFSDYIACVEAANSGRVHVKVMQASDFSRWKDYSSQSKISRCQPRPYLADVVYIKAVRGRNTLAYKMTFVAQK